MILDMCCSRRGSNFFYLLVSPRASTAVVLYANQRRTQFCLVMRTACVACFWPACPSAAAVATLSHESAFIFNPPIRAPSVDYASTAAAAKLPVPLLTEQTNSRFESETNRKRLDRRQRLRLYCPTHRASHVSSLRGLAASVRPTSLAAFTASGMLNESAGGPTHEANLPAEEEKGHAKIGR